MRVLLAVALVSAVAHAAVPRLVPHEGRLLRADGQPERGTWQLTFKLYSVPDGGAALWSETHTLAVAPSGHYAVLLGAQTALPALDGAAWLGVTVAGEQEMAPRTQLASAPFALRAAEADAASVAARLRVDWRAATPGNSSGQQLRLARAAGDFAGAVRLEWEGAKVAGAGSGKGTLVARVAMRGSSTTPGEDFFRLESLARSGAAPFTRLRVVRDADSAFYLEAFVPATHDPGLVTATLVESEPVGALALLAPSYVAAVSPVVHWDVLVDGVSFAVGAGDGRSFAVSDAGQARAQSLRFPDASVQTTATDGDHLVDATCNNSTTNFSSCTATCPAGYRVSGGGCDANGSASQWNQIFTSRPTADRTGWFCSVSVDWEHSGTMQVTGYAICMKR